MSDATLRNTIKKTPPGKWVGILTETMDLIALGALFSTGEVSMKTWGIVLGLYFLRYFRSIRFKPFWMIVAFVALIFSTLWIHFSLQYHPIVAVAHTLPVVHVLLALVDDKNRYRGWRMGVGFVALILASAISPEFIVPICVFAYIVVGSVNISCRFLIDELNRHVKKEEDRQLPKNFIKRGLSQALLLFVSAAIIFPILPRMTNRMGAGIGGSTSQTGYTEEVGLTEWTKFTQGSSSGVALRVYLEEDQDMDLMIPFGLLRTRALPLFDGKSWEPLIRSQEGRGTLQDRKIGKTSKFRVVRESIGSPALPVPYGTYRTLIDVMGMQYYAQATGSNEWMEYRARNRRYNYEVEVVNSEDLKENGFPLDEAGPLHLSVPEKYRKTRIEGLANTLFKGIKDPRKKVEAVQAYFRKENFQPYLGEDLKEGEELIFSEANSKMTTLEYFLFEKKKGHCELFSTAMAVLLRMGGVPTRLISGFRVSRMPFDDVLTVRMADAHAWVEYYRDGPGWFPLDPTPRRLGDVSLTDWARDSYDWLSGKWYQYVLSYGENPSEIADRWQSMKSTLKQFASGKGDDLDDGSKRDLAVFLVGFIFVAGGFCLLVLKFYRVRRKRPMNIEGSAQLQRERRRFERVLRQHGYRRENERRFYVKPELQSKIESWDHYYAKVRFGRPSESVKKDMLRLKELRKEIHHDFDQAA